MLHWNRWNRGYTDPQVKKPQRVPTRGTGRPPPTVPPWGHSTPPNLFHEAAFCHCYICKMLILNEIRLNMSGTMTGTDLF